MLPNCTSPVCAIKPSITLWNATPSYNPELTRDFILSTCKGAKSGISFILIFPFASPATSITRLLAAKIGFKRNIPKINAKNIFLEKTYLNNFNFLYKIWIINLSIIKLITFFYFIYYVHTFYNSSPRSILIVQMWTFFKHNKKLAISRVWTL